MDELESRRMLPREEKVFFAKLKTGLKKTRDSLVAGLGRTVHGKLKENKETLDELEEGLLKADIGFQTVQEILSGLRDELDKKRVCSKEMIRKRLQFFLTRILEENESDDILLENIPQVILVVGINGSGKTTTIGKLAQRWKQEGKTIMVVAGDTFRAAATEQLQIWADRVGVTCIHQKKGSDPSAVVYDAVKSAIARKVDTVLVDTAGRLQTNVNLMEEIKKVKRVIGKILPGAPPQTLLVLDASIGQNSIAQAKLFHKALQIDGLVMTKLDGTSKGGILFNVSRELRVPVRFVGVGEKLEDLQPFDIDTFVRALLEE